MCAELPDVTVTDLQGNEHPIEYAGANILHQALHLNPRVWPRASDFLPERFLVGPDHELHRTAFSSKVPGTVLDKHWCRMS